MKIPRRAPLLVTVAWLLGLSLCYAASHPTPVTESSNCLECHADLATGDHVHAAVTKGCLSCHSIENRESVTYVVLKPAKTIICFECHQPEAFLYPHFPYASGDCLRCHNPHVAANPNLLRSQVNELCLKCHLRRPESAPSRYMPTITLTPDQRLGHPYEAHPVSGSRDPLTGGEMSCVSCHKAHGATKLHLLKMGSEIPEDAMNQNTETKDMCRKCHLLMWGLEGASIKKKNKKKDH
ncbi:MAG: cytochrome c3 family protein [Candidatus Sulfotelmatobacter sp.]